jgi:hypothetical protein
VARPWVNLRRERVVLSTDHVTSCAPSIPEVPLRAGAKQNVAPNTDKPPYRCRARSTATASHSKLLAWNNGGTAEPSVCAAFPDGHGIAPVSASNVNHSLLVRTDTETAR